MLRSSSHELLLDRRRSLPALKVPYRNSRRRLLPALQARHQIVLACFLATFTAYVERVGFSIAYTAMAKEAKVPISCSAGGIHQCIAERWRSCHDLAVAVCSPRRRACYSSSPALPKAILAELQV